MMLGRFRVKCPACGEVQDINAPAACKKCRGNIQPMGGEVRLYRMGSPIGIAMGFGVYIDNLPYGHIGNKETVAYSLPFGTHTIHVTAGASRRCTDLTVTLTPQAPVGTIKAHLKPGFLSNTIVLEPCAPDQMPVSM